ncbi:MAG: alanine--tRNA ligase-related protein [Clostridiales bacterium]|nr:alanine--tRNA ligase-related protein [Clostridiales bacterium]
MEDTERLYYKDSHMRAFTGTVESCEWEEKKSCYGVVLDRTAFFPEGGGQHADTGILGGVPVEDVKERGGLVVHYMKQPLTVGETVKGELDFRVRFSAMQQHSGEHIFSGLVHRHFGYDNVGFHLGREIVTMDFNGLFTEEQLCQIEQEANEAVAANVEVLVTYPTKEELANLNYRSKKELDGQVRIVTIPGYDVCACCAPHVTRTGEIGLIKVTDAVKYKGGTRVTIVCGFRALQDYRVKESNVKEISHLLSAKPYEVADAVRRLQGETAQWRDRLLRMQNRYLERKLAEIPADAQHVILFEAELDKNTVRKFVDAGKGRCAGICAVFLGDEAQGWQYTIGSQSVDVKALLSEFHAQFAGKGGGKPEMVQGTLRGGVSEKDIQTFFVER